MKNASKILALLGGASVLAVMAGLPVDANGFFLTEDQMTKLDAAVDANEALTAELVTAKDELLEAKAGLVTVTEELATANTSLVTANTELVTANTALATAQARITELEALDTVKPSATVTDQDPVVAAAQTDKKKYMSYYDTLFN